jgi:DNA-binding CsgD family transcriptional regulator
MAGADGSEVQLSVRVLTIALALTLWIALGSLVLAMANLGGNPVRRVFIGVAFVLAAALALLCRDGVCRALRSHPSTMVAVAIVSLCAVVADGIDGPYFALTETAIGVTAVVARPRTVWLCVAVLEAGYAGAVFVVRSPGQLAGVLGALFAYPFVACVLLGLAGLYKRFLVNVDEVVVAIRSGSPALTPALTRAIALGGGDPVKLLGAPPPLSGLSTDELRVVAGLASGARPKQLAYAWGVSLPTVRKHIRLAKRKTGARTLPELAAMAARHDTPDAQP